MERAKRITLPPITRSWTMAKCDDSGRVVLSTTFECEDGTVVQFVLPFVDRGCYAGFKDSTSPTMMDQPHINRHPPVYDIQVGVDPESISSFTSQKHRAQSLLTMRW